MTLPDDFSARIERTDRTDEAAWIEARLRPFASHTATSVVPGGFESYARLLHPSTRRDATGGPPEVRWAEVSAWSGVPMSRDVQFHQVAFPRSEQPTPPPWDGETACGTLTLGDATALVGILKRHTSTPSRCWFGVWDGYGGWESRDTGAPSRPGGAMPKVELPGRSYLLYKGPIEGALAFPAPSFQTPNLWWPSDHSWCVASEIDLNWTYVGGATALIQDLLRSRSLEAVPVEPDDSCVFQLVAADASTFRKATETLQRDGTVSVSTTLGEIEATLTGRGPRSTLAISWQRHGGGSGRSTTTLDGSDSDLIGAFLGLALENLLRS